ncbi:c-type cytochrome [uncultured Jatrophihabitans sp.]|uniref:cytochrome bc1 complex diheme cytochrome c subunit n=1 Tax=uncultured Jatrophihabitans sp. TaxID=1610747 RepID=UPI0035CBB3E3
MTEETDVDADYGFEPAVSATGAPAAQPAARLNRGAGASWGRRPRRSAVRRKLSALAIMVGALAAMGGAYAAFATSSGAQESSTSAQQITAGQQLYQVSCITCHGANLQGIKNQGPSLIGVGGAAVYFQVSTGRMPLAAQGAYAARKEAKYDEAQTEQLAAFVENVGGGPKIPTGELRGGSATIAAGGSLFRLNCASCHGTTGKGAPLSAGKIAPSLNEATDKQFYTAMLSGPESMPVFSDQEITPAQKRSIIAYVQALRSSADPGGAGVDRIGPVSEAIVIWAGGVGVLMIAILWIGARVR